MIAQKDIVEATIKTAMGDDISKLDVSLNGEEGGYWGLNVLHSTREGRYQGVVYSDKAKAALVREEIQKKYGDQVHPFRRCNDLIGLIFLHSASHKDMDDLMLDTNQSMRVIIK